MPHTLSSPQILDVTIRDGGYLINHQFEPSKVGEISKALRSSGLDFVEVSHGMGVGSRMSGKPGRADDYEMLEAAKAAAPDLKLSVFIDPQEFCLPIIPGLIEFIDLGRVAFKKDEVRNIEKVIAKLKKYNKQVSIQLVFSDCHSVEQITEFAKTSANMGAEIIYIVDSLGSMQPEQVRDYVQAVQNTCKVAIGFHGHNHLGMALANTLAAWEEGASWLDASLMGAGRDAGNASMETLVMKVQNRGFLSEIDLERLCEVVQKNILPLYNRPPASRLLDIVCAEEKIYCSPPESLELFANSLHISFQTFAKSLKKNMGNEFTVTDTVLNETIEDFGFDYKQILEALYGNKNEHS